MGLTSQQLTYLKTADQRFRARVGVFPAYAPTITYTQPGSSGTAISLKPIPMVSPRLSIVNNGASITLYATDSYNRGGAYVGNANIAWSNTGGAGSLTDNGDGTATYTAPAGSGTNAITMTATNANGSKSAVAYVQYPNTTNDTIVADIASISGGVEQHGWNVLLRVAGDAAAFTIGSRLLIHVEDTWAGTTSTFGGYKYPEGVISGYIKQVEYFEDGFGQTYLGVEVAPLWWILERLKLGETWWGQTAAAGRFYLAGFAPVDAVWYLVNEITDVTKYHNVTMFYDTNQIDDFVIEESNLSTIIEDCMARGLTKSFTDRYGSLMCIPDPDVRAGEWWGTPSPVFDSAGAGPLTEQFCLDYDIIYNTYQTRKLSVQALDHSLMGLWAISQNTASSLGDIVSWPGKLLCDTPTALAQWTVQLRAKLNRKWQINATRFLDHTIDLMNFVDVNFTSPSQTNGLTASGSTWVNSVNYRPNIFDGGWIGVWELYKQTTGDTDGTSAWGGTGQFWGGVPGWPPTGPGSGSWGNTAGGQTAFCHTFDFVNSGQQGWTVYTDSSGTALGSFAAGQGFKTEWVSSVDAGTIYEWVIFGRKFPTRTINSMTYYVAADISAPQALWSNYVTGYHVNLSPPGAGTDPTGSAVVASSVVSNELVGQYNLQFSGHQGYVRSAILCGSGADPFN